MGLRVAFSSPRGARPESELTDTDRLDCLRKLDLPWGTGRFDSELAAVVSFSDYAYGLIQRHPQWDGRTTGSASTQAGEAAE